MDESALESFFDHFIADDSWREQEEEEQQEEQEEEEEEEFFSSLPEELLTLTQARPGPTAAADDDDDDDDGSTTVFQDHNSQNAAGSAPPDGSTTPQFTSQIENIQCTVKLGCRLDLDFIAHKARNVEYKPKGMKMVTMRIRAPPTTALIFASGNMVCSGAKSEEHARLAARRFARIVQKLGFPVRFLNFKIHNLVASCKSFPVSLERMSLEPHCSYEPEIFPGLFFSGVTGVSVVIFPSGKMCLAGAKKKSEIQAALDIVCPFVSCFRRKDGDEP